MRDNILNVLSNSDRALDIFELQDLLEINTVEDTSKLSDELRKLEDEVVIYHTNKDKYMLFEYSHLKKGKISSAEFKLLSAGNDFIQHSEIKGRMAKFADVTINFEDLLVKGGEKNA